MSLLSQELKQAILSEHGMSRETALELTTILQTILDDGVMSFNTRTGIVVAETSDYTADQVDYDNASSGLTATDVQAAVDEVEDRVDTVQTDLSTAQSDISDLQAIPVTMSFTSDAGAGGAATEVMVVTGLLATDTIIAVTQMTPGTNNLPLLGYSTQDDDALTAIYSADPDADAVIVVTVLR